MARLAAFAGTGPLASDIAAVEPVILGTEGATFVMTELPLLFTVMMTIRSSPTVISAGALIPAESDGLATVGTVVNVYVAVGGFVFVHVAVLVNVLVFVGVYVHV